MCSQFIYKKCNKNFSFKISSIIKFYDRIDAFIFHRNYNEYIYKTGFPSQKCFHIPTFIENNNIDLDINNK
jgi:hypothetical protein